MRKVKDIVEFFPYAKHRPLRGGGSWNGVLALDCTHRDALGKVLLEGQEHDDDGHGGQGGTGHDEAVVGGVLGLQLGNAQGLSLIHI